MAITVYRSDDPSAPLLNNTIGAFTNLMKAILVDGYGAKPSAGWTLELEDAPSGRAIVKNATGKMFWIKHDQYNTTDDTNTDIGYRIAHIIGLESYTDINVESLMGTYPNNFNSKFTDLPYSYRQAASITICEATTFSNGIKWIAFADSKTIYICLQIKSYDDSDILTLNPKPVNHISPDRFSDNIVGFGDYYIKGHDETFNGFLGGCKYEYDVSSTYTSLAFVNNTAPLSNNSDGWIQRIPDGEPGAIEYGGFTEIGTEVFSWGGGRNYNVTTGYTKFPYYGGVCMSRVNLLPYYSSQELTNYDYKDFNGRYRGFHLISHTINNSIGDRIGEWGDTFTSNGRDYYLISANVSKSPSDNTLAIDITGWD